MLNRLRIQLTLVYGAVGLVMLGIMAVGVYLGIAQYFEQITDLALRHKMTHEFHLLGASIPADLRDADRDWSILRGEIQREGEQEQEDEQDPTERFVASAYDAELSAIFVLPLDQYGRLLFDPNPYTPPVTVDHSALNAALSQGSDLRTVTNTNGQQVRLLTYRLTRSDGPAALQLGRILDDQQRLRDQLVIWLVGLGSIGVAVIGLLSWWLSGRAVRPAEAAWERQQAFVASASHELRTPLTLIRASTEVALRHADPNNTDQRELLEDILSESDHMRRLVDDLLTLSRLDAERLPLSFQNTPLADLLESVQRHVARIAEQRQIQIDLLHATGSVHVDPDRLRQVLLIALDNALRYTPAGGRIQLEAHPNNGKHVITIRDNGSGIVAEHLPHLFERFYQADQARTSGSGAGLGLAIAKGLVDAMHGTIEITSQIGSGTTVILTFDSAGQE
ncbi:MAG: hypothetical protein Fur005_18110 [Roseiflexaceae bacterium]